MIEFIYFHEIITEPLKFETGKPVKPDELRKIESIVNEQIEAELDVFAKEATLTDAKRINGLRAVFGEVSYSSFLIFLCSSVSHKLNLRSYSWSFSSRLQYVIYLCNIGLSRPSEGCVNWPKSGGSSC